jgi:hypothetical protein
MKKILSFLLSVVFLHSQTVPLYAKHGGPDPVGGQDSDGVVDLVGTYSGSLIPEDPVAAGTPALDGSGVINSLGLFTLGIPVAGNGVGTFLVFTQGIQFDGTIVAIGDPSNASINGIVEGSYDFVDFLYDPAGNIILDPTGQPIIQNYTATIRGILQAQVLPGEGSTTVASTGLTQTFQRIEGTAEMGIVFQGVTDSVLRYTVDGVKQSTATGTAGTTVP